MKLSKLHFLFLSLSLVVPILLVSPARADWPPIAPEDLKMTDLPQQKGAPAVVLLREEVADDTNNNHSVYMRIKVLTEAGRRYADVEIPYSRRQFRIDSVSGRTVHADGSVVPLTGKVFDKVVVKGKRGHGEEIRWHVKSFTMPDVQVGSILDFRYSLRYDDHTAFAPEWIVQSDLFQKNASFKFIPYPGDLILAHDRVGRGSAWTSYLPTDGPKPQWHRLMTTTMASSRTADQFVDLALTNVPPVIEEPYMPPANMLRYRVQFYYTIDKNSETFWKEEGKFWSKDVEKFLDKKGGVQDLVAKTVAASDNPEQKLRKLYAFVTTLENQSFRPQRQAEESKAISLKPNESAEDVLRQQSGTHDDLNRLFAALARAAGFPASMMWVPSRDDTFFEPELMSTHQLSNEITIVQLNGKDMFLDPGTKYCPFGLLDWRYSGSKGLRQRLEKGTEIVQSPVGEYNQAQIQRLARVQLTEEGKVEGTVKVGFYGLEGMDRRQKANNTDAEGRKKLLEDEMRSWLPADSEVTMVGAPNWDDTEVHLAAEFKISAPMAVGAGKRLLVPVHIFQTNNKPVFSASERVNPIYFWYLTREIDEVHITLPSSLEVENLPANDTMKLDYAYYSTVQKQETPNTIMARRDLIMGGMAFPVAEYKNLKGFYDKVKTGDDQQMIARGSAHAEAK
jgi:hypothetical protein